MLSDALRLAVSAAREAGELLRRDFHRPGGPRGSGDHADADDEAEALIRARLLAATGWQFRGEETGYQSGDPHFCWVVDPNDGTSGYLKGTRGSAVSIAALRDGIPVLGVVFAFGFPDDTGDLLAWAEGCPFTRNGRELTHSLADAPPPGPGSIILVARAADQRPAAHAIRVRPARHSPCASIAYRLARAAAGDADAALGLAGMAAYDVAAGHALLRGVGGVLLNEAGREVTYSANGIGPVRHAFGGTPAAAAALAARRDWDNLGPAVAFRPPFCLHLPRPGRAVADPGVLARAQGCLLGQFAGDSLGGLVEFCSVESIRERYPDGVRDLADGGTWHNLAGQLTDDSEMALMLARSLVHRGRHDPAAVLDAYCHWWPDAFDHGGTLRAAIGPAVGLPPADRLASVERTANAASQSNGSLMRISPLGVWGAFGTGAAEAARADSRLTHPNPACVDACAALVAAIAHAVRHGDGPEAAHAAAVAEARESAVRAALEAARQTPPADYVANMGWVLTALQNAFWQLLHAPSLEAGVIDTVSRGGDTDTTAAIAGALLGAVHGRDAVPDRWRRAVLTCRPLPGTATRHPRPMEFWPVDALELAEALLAAGRDGAAV